jgi:hypothetical protein
VPGRAALESAETVVTPDASNGFVLLTDGQAAARAPAARYASVVVWAWSMRVGARRC